MRNGRPKPLLELTDAEAMQLQSFVRSRWLPASLCQRARIVLASASGENNTDIATRLELSKATVGKWRASFLEKRIA
jgi:putative transposase